MIHSSIIHIRKEQAVFVTHKTSIDNKVRIKTHVTITQQAMLWHLWDASTVGVIPRAHKKLVRNSFVDVHMQVIVAFLLVNRPVCPQYRKKSFYFIDLTN